MDYTVRMRPGINLSPACRCSTECAV